MRKGLLVGILMMLICGPALAAPEWQPPVDLIPPDRWTTKGPAVALSERGDLAVVWSERYDSYNTAVKGMIRPAGGSFSQPHEVSDPAGSDPNPRPFITTGQNTSPRVAIGPTGEAVVVWLRNGCVRAMAIPPGGAAGPRGWVSCNETEEEAHLLDFGMDGSGAVSATWAGDNHVQYAHRPRGGTFTPRQTLPNPGLYAHAPSLAVSAGGAVGAIWHDYENVYAAVRDSGRGFSPTQTLEVPQGGDAPDIAMDAHGNAVAVWINRVPTDASQGEVRVAYRPAGGTFANAQTVARAWYAEPKVVMSAEGEAIVFWAGGASDVTNPARITALSRSPAGAIGGLEPVATDWYGLPRMVFDAGGTAYAAWQAIFADQDYATYAAVRPAGEAFTGKTQRLSPNPSWGPPALAAAAPGHAAAVWPEPLGNQVGLKLAEHGEPSGTQPSPPGADHAPVQPAGAVSGPKASTAGPKPSTAGPLESLSLRRVQRGAAVRGLARIRQAGCALEGTLHRAGAVLGRTRRAGLPSGAVPFAVRLARSARASLRASGRLKLRLRVVVTCAGEARAAASRPVTVRPR